eukprot:CAMPEP_0194215702 /NCGR_PEP_ID=MMETSP0156-20130528/17712_1 /TAXON_ID=33649 /ORGANISM="Thalassionema nitzschioides, Strain L26-B" /LENGTH=276 /DNA_ID=CAMNT_0038944297 /DNA_START=92 /DNA_END=922 /DNA_ORIENTATION=-
MKAIDNEDGVVIQKRLSLQSCGKSVVIISINRPTKKNCFNTKVATSLARIFRSLQNDANDDIAAIILTGEGSSFCVGADLANPPNPIWQSSDLPHHLIDNPVHQMSLSSIPIIAALKGYVITGGFELALACDILVGDQTVVFRDTHCKFNLAPCWGLSQKLQRRIGVGRAKLMSMGAIPIKAPQAHSWGLLDILVHEESSLERAVKIADSIGKNSPDMVVRYKKAIDEGGNMTLEQGLKRERALAMAHYIEIVQDNETFNDAKDYITDANRPRSKL